MKAARAIRLYWQPGLALAIILLFVGVALAAPLLAPPTGSGVNGAFRLVPVSGNRPPNPPSAVYPLGTVPTGRLNVQLDVYFTLIWGARSALIFGLSATLLISVFGSLVGAVSSFLGGTAGQIILRVTDAFLAFPIIAGVVLFGQLVLPGTPVSAPSPLRTSLDLLGVDNVMLAMVFLGWMPYARVIYSDMERIRQSDFVLAAQSTGARPARIILRHLIPNSISNVIVLATRDVSALVLLQATFTYLGVGGRSDWGSLLATGHVWILGTGGNPLENWWVFVPVTLALVIFGIGWNLLGDFLNEYLNPRLRQALPD